MKIDVVKDVEITSLLISKDDVENEIIHTSFEINNEILERKTGSNTDHGQEHLSEVFARMTFLPCRSASLANSLRTLPTPNRNGFKR